MIQTYSSYKTKKCIHKENKKSTWIPVAGHKKYSIYMAFGGPMKVPSQITWICRKCGEIQYTKEKKVPK